MKQEKQIISDATSNLVMTCFVSFTLDSGMGVTIMEFIELVHVDGNYVVNPAEHQHVNQWDMENMPQGKKPFIGAELRSILKCLDIGTNMSGVIFI